MPAIYIVQLIIKHVNPWISMKMITEHTQVPRPCSLCECDIWIIGVFNLHLDLGARINRPHRDRDRSAELTFASFVWLHLSCVIHRS